ncbi:hypothetical protein [Cohnella terricola]|uniref:DUF4179 domain-containing protein n=1 Tax=Cohnella terricola TaxID=1289167 RepID=A0A559JIM6_9BACL|nr:hypothetical protein [Cohnella terricola]TVX99718.1 hypothetical protein FPZ45_12235 [Cohnella terricola]
MNDSEKLDRLLKQALASEEEPEEKLNEELINRYKERNRMKRGTRKRLSAGVLVAVLAVALSATAYAATQLFSSKQVAEHLGEKALAGAFGSSDAIEINKTVTSGGYEVTLHGIVSGAGLRGLDASGISSDRTYAVVSVARQDGSPMPKTSDPEYGKDPFFVSPLIKGLKPWQVNIFTMKGGYAETVVDGIAYRLIECDGVEMFADRGVYLAVSSGGSFFSKDAFVYDEQTGEIAPNGDYAGAAVLFDLPLDKVKADPAKADAYLRELLKEPSDEKTSEASASPGSPEDELVNEMERLNSKIPDAKVLEGSVLEVGYDGKGNIVYDYDGWHVVRLAETLFTEGQTGEWVVAGFSGDDSGYKALQFSKDEQGVVKGRILLLD